MASEFIHVIMTESRNVVDIGKGKREKKTAQ